MNFEEIVEHPAQLNILLQLRPRQELYLFFHSFAFFRPFFEMLYVAYYWMVVFPFSRLYIYGPNLRGFGFWNGITCSEICAHLSGSSGPSVHHFLKNEDECYEMIHRDFSSKLIFLEVMILYPILVYLIFRLLTKLFDKLWSKNKN